MNGLLLQITQQTTAVAEQVATTQPTEETLSILALSLKGGIIMIPLLIFSLIACYIFIERYITLRKAGEENGDFMNNIRDFIHDGRIDAALALCKKDNKPMVKMIEKGLMRMGKPLNDINAAIENVGKLEVARLEKGLPTLATIAGAAPMLGFLGTVTGMVKAFYTMANAGNDINIQLLAGGIYEAMVTTVAGLIVGIFGYIAYNILVAKIEKIVYILEARATEFIDILHEPANK